jgi:tetratricopeptide (TPR) repeat protein
VAYTLAVDKAENMLAEYFRKYGEYTLTGDAADKLALDLMCREMNSVCRLYRSHRLYVYQSCISIFHRLFVDEGEESYDDDLEPIEDILANVQKIFEEYNLDTIYYHLRIVFEYLKLEYYDHYKVFRKAENYFEDVNDSCADLLENYTLYTYPSQFLLTKIKRHLRTNTVETMHDENEVLFHDYEADKNDLPNYLTYVIYRSLSCYYNNRYDEAARWVNNLLNEISLKKYPNAQLEIKAILALQYCMMRDYDLFHQLINSIQRQIRMLGKDACEHIVIFTKMLKISLSDSKKNKKSKIVALAEKIKNVELDYFTPTMLVKLDENLITALGKL